MAITPLDTSNITLPTSAKGLPEANQNYLSQINSALQSDPQGQYYILHANSGDTSAVKQLYALAAQKGMPIPDNATFAGGYFQNTGGGPSWEPLAVGAGIIGAGVGAEALLPALFGGGAAAGGAGAAGAAGAGGSSLPFASTAPGLLPFGTTGVTGGGIAAGATGAASAGGAAAGALSKADILSKLGSAITAINTGAASGRAAEATANQNQYKTQLQGLNAQLNRAQIAKSLQEQDYADQVRGSLLQNLQDFTVTPPAGSLVAAHMPTISGGLRPSAVADRGAIGSQMENAAALDLLQKGNPNSGYTAATTAPMPTLPNLPTPNAGQNILSYLGPGLSIGGLIKQLATGTK